MAQQTWIPRLGAGALAAVCALCSGCTTGPADPPSSLRRIDDPARAWTVAVGSWPDAAGMPVSDLGPEATRRDDSLAVRAPGPLLATNEWPEPDRPSLVRARRLFLDRDPSSVLYFPSRAEYHGGRHGDGWWPRAGWR